MPRGRKKWKKATTFLESWRHAWRGVGHTVKAERNFRIQLCGLLIVLAVSWWLGVSTTELALLLVVATIVLTLELVNTAVEMLADVVRPQYHNTIGMLKDVTAAAVLIASVAAIMVGFLIIVPAVVG